MHLSAVGGFCLLFLPLSAAAAALHDGQPHGGARALRRDDSNHHLRAILPDPTDTKTGHTTQAASSNPPDETTTTTTATSAAPATTTTPSSSSVPTTSAPTTTTTVPASTRAITTDPNGSVVVSVVTSFASASSASPTATDAPDNSGPSQGTFIGLGVAGGIALIALIGFIIWKFTQKRFSQFDDDGADINWPMPKEELAPPKAPAMASAAANATSSSVDLTASDPYAVPPLPQRTGPYYDDPSGTAAAGYYDPYRGPVPHTFHSPPGSVDSHAHQYAEAIPMSTYSSASGRQSPGPNAAYEQDPYAQNRSPGPNMAYGAGVVEDPYGAGGRNPGSGLAYGMDPARSGTPASMMAPPRMGTPLAGGGYPPPNIPPGLDVPRAGTPQSYGRASPAIPAAYAAQQPLVNPYGRSTPNPYGQ